MGKEKEKVGVENENGNEVDLNAVLLAKKNLHHTTFYKQLPLQFRNCHYYIRLLRPLEEPNYSYLKQLFLTCLKTIQVPFGRVEKKSHEKIYTIMENVSEEVSNSLSFVV